uniref:Uncharacterized protein n=1 Tax=Oryza rufipogon TaxID=4529 RepID=A0A0E0MSC5_ORYRU
MTALARIHGGKMALTTLDDRSGSGTPFTATATITAGTSTPATITAAGFRIEILTRQNREEKALKSKREQEQSHSSSREPASPRARKPEWSSQPGRVACV